MDKPIVVSDTALPTSVGTLLRYVLTVLAGMAMSKGLLPEGTDVQPIIGAVVALASAGYGVYLAWRNHKQKQLLANYAPDSVAQVKRS